mgnify:CR=1 FL=1
MIARMSKYDFILYAGQSDDFIERLRELGLVDVTCRGWEPSEGDRQLVTAIEGRTKALAALERFRSSEHFDAAARPFASGDEAYERYGRTAQERAALRTEIGQTEKAAEKSPHESRSVSESSMPLLSTTPTLLFGPLRSPTCEGRLTVRRMPSVRLRNQSAENRTRLPKAEKSIPAS